MENTEVQKISGSSLQCVFVSNGYIYTENEIVSESGSFALQHPAGAVKAAAFYAAISGEEFKTAALSGDIFRAEKKNKYRWELVAEVKESAVIGCSFNSDNGNLLLCTKKEIFLIDKDVNLIKQIEIKESVRAEIEKDKQAEARAEWSANKKYILLTLGSVVCVFGYNLEEVSNTMSSCNRVMNSRLVKTKKYLAHESTYVDVVRRVPMPDDIEELSAETGKKDSVLFEERTKYKLAAWHSRFSLIYAVSEANTIYVLERNSLKFKEIQHIRCKDQKAEQIERNNILSIVPSGDYLYVIHEETSARYLKIYYIKNNKIYLKYSACLSALLPNESTKESNGADVVNGGSTAMDNSPAPPAKYTPSTRARAPVLQVDPSGSVIRIYAESGTAVLKHEKKLNRTDREVVDIDGTRALLYDLYKTCIPPPMFSSYIALRGIPESIRCYAPQTIEYSVNGSLHAASTCAGYPRDTPHEELKNRLQAFSLASLPTEITESSESLNVQLGSALSHITLRDKELTVRTEREARTVRGVTSAAIVQLDVNYLLVTTDRFSWTAVSKIAIRKICGEEKIEEEDVLKTGKGCKIAFATSEKILLITGYGMLETFYPQFMVEHAVEKSAKAGDLRHALYLAKRHGASPESVVPYLISSLRAGNAPPQLLLDITKHLLLSSPQNPQVQEIESHAESVVKKHILSFSSADASSSGISEGKEDVAAICSVLVEIYLAQKRHGEIASLAHAFVKEKPFASHTLAKHPEHALSLSIVKRALQVAQKDELLRICMENYFYTLCYIILMATNSPHDEVNDTLLIPGRAAISPQDTREEIERRSKIAALLKDRKKRVVYIVIKHVFEQCQSAGILENTEPQPEGLDRNTGLDEDLSHIALRAAQLARAEFSALNIRDYHLYLLDGPAGTESVLFKKNKSYRTLFEKTRSQLLASSGDALRKEGELDEALLCYESAESAGEEKAAQSADEVRLALGRWEKLFSFPRNVTPENIQKIEDVLLGKKETENAAEMHIRHGRKERGAELYVRAEQYAKLLEWVAQCDSRSVIAALSFANQRLQEYMESTESLTEKYKEHRARLHAVRERKNREREEILGGMHAENDYDTVAYSRTFITNTFMSGSSSSRTKKRASKLRNTVGGRYEEEYVQYVLRELVTRAEEIAGHRDAIGRVYERAYEEKRAEIPESVRNKHSRLNRLLEQTLRKFIELVEPGVDSDFASQNTEEDPLYDPGRPLISKPDLSFGAKLAI